VNNESEKVGRMTMVEWDATLPHMPKRTTRKKHTNKQKMSEKLVSGLKAAGKLA
jgi:hypothetical protein